MVDKLDGLLVWVLQEAAPEVHLCSQQLELGHNTSAQRMESLLHSKGQSAKLNASVTVT